MKLVAFAGYGGSGKDAAADYIAERYGFYRLKFAGTIKAMVGVMLNVPPRKIEDRAWKESPIEWLDGQVTPRQLLQTLGTEWGRTLVHPDVWVRATMNRVAGMGWVVISDCRFDNEAQAVRAAGGLVIWIDRPGYGPVNEHESETALSDSCIDQRIANDSGLPGLFKQIDWVMEKMACPAREPDWRFDNE